ncbi:hypothetical protein KR018_006149, partial [Drosophila ironensis]
KKFKFKSINVITFISQIFTTFEFTNIKCLSFDKEFSDFETCRIKAVNRTYKYVTFKCNLYKGPIKKIKINIVLYKRFNGYRPFMYNITVDACRFFNNQNSNLIFKYFYQFVANSNIDHPCPYEDFVELRQLSTQYVNDLFTNVLPFPEGDYQLEVNAYAYDIKRAVVKVYGTLS